MKGILIGLMMLLAFQSMAGGDKQSQNVVYGNHYFEAEDYFLAAEYYNKELEKNPSNTYAIYQLAACYRLIFDYKNAEIWYQKAIDLATDEYPDAAYYHALMLKMNGEYLLAAGEFEMFIATYEASTETDPIPDLAILHYNGCILALNSFKKPIRDFGYRNDGAPLNSEMSDFAPAFYNHDSSLVIASSRFDEKNEAVYGRFGEAYLDNFVFEKNDSAWVLLTADSLKDDFLSINTKYNDGAGTFNSTRDKYYFTRCDEKLVDGLGYNCAIYVTKKEGEKWQEAQKLNTNVNPKGEWNAQPTLNPTNDTLFFVSKRPGGFGKHDIYYSVLEGDNENWGAAVNMGDKINTQHIEVSPSYYSAEHVLFFASDGHEGFGGLDIFMAKGKKLDTIRNVGLPFNSNRDDFGIVLGDSIGYMASNRSVGLGSDDLYSFNIRSTEALIAMISTDSVSSGTVTIRGALTDLMEEAAEGVTVLLTDTAGMILKTTTTNVEGDFVFSNLSSDMDYRVILEDKDGRLTTEIVYNVDDVEVFVHDEKVNTTSLAAAEAGAPSRVLFENIYFDYNMHELRPEAVKVLGELIAYSEKHPELQIEISAHTDATGSHAYNEALAFKRGQSAYNYLVKNGLQKSTIVVNAVGESKPIASNDHEIGRQLNRRIEFHVVGGGGFEAEAMAYVVEPATSLHEIANRFGMTVGEIKEMNDLDGDHVEAFTPLRVKRKEDSHVVATSSLSYEAPVANTEEKAEQINEPEPVKTELNTEVQEGTSSMKVVEDHGEEIVYLNNSKWNDGVKYHGFHGEHYYVVMPKNTLYSISRITSIPVADLVSFNSIENNTIFIGQVLRTSEDVPEPIYNEDGSVILEGKKYHVVKEGETLGGIANTFGLSLEDIKAKNGEEVEASVGRLLLLD